MKITTKPTVDSVRQLGVDFSADGKITARERAQLQRDYRLLGAADRPAALDALRGAAPKAAAAVTRTVGPIDVNELKAQINTDIAAGPTGLASKSKNELRKAGISPRTLTNYFRLGTDERYQVRQYLQQLGFPTKAIKEFTTPPLPAFPSWSAFANTGKFVPGNE
jgi:hypothetical protein